ncbi:MAG: hypothetical protein JXR86_16355 [Spirochaetales bacterium]|nr:hypothetical protein [Spirochaetales bacterium]
MNKRLIAAFAALLCLGMSLFSDVKVTDRGDGTVDILFTTPDDGYGDLYLIGSFNSWVEPGDAMVLGADNIWEISLEADSLDEIKYKFFCDGAYISDVNAPDEVDDGFGGFNGLVVVEDLLNAEPVVAEAAESGEAVATDVPVKREKLAFGTVTYIESETNFNSDQGDFEGTDSLLNSKSVWTLKGDAVKRMPVHLEVLFFEGSVPVWEKDPAPADDTVDGVELVDGLEKLGAGLIFVPAYYLGGNNRPVLDQISFGFDTPWISYETGYGSAAVPARTSIIWDTIEEDGTDAGDGYSLFRLGEDLREIGDFSLDLAVMPHKSLNDYYGLTAYVSGEYGPAVLDFQYNLRTSTTDDPKELFQDPARQDIIAGAGVYVGPLSVETQFLYSIYLQGGTVNARPFADKMALEGLLGFEKEDLFGAELGFKYRGFAAQMLFADNDSVLGESETMTFSAGGWMQFGNKIVPRLNGEAVIPNGSQAGGNVAISFTPGVGIEMPFGEATMSLDASVTMGIDTQPAAGDSSFYLADIVADFSTGMLIPGVLEGLNIHYSLDNSTTDDLFNTLLAEADFPYGLKAQLGAGLRTGDAVDNPFGIFAGAAWKIDEEQVFSPELYINFTFNMDPYDADNRTAYKYDGDGLLDEGSAKSDGNSALRLGVQWSY